MHVHVDPFSGVAGDMLLGALVDAGVPLDALEAGLRGLGVPGWRLEETGKRDPRVGGRKVAVRVEGADGHAPEDPHHEDPHHGDHHHEDHHHGDHHHAHEQGGHPHRHLPEILALLEASGLPAPVRERSQRVFRLLADAEAEVHGTTPERVHFHEVGAVDAIVDIAGVCLGLHLLGATGLSCGPLPLGSGFVRCAHGTIPVPVPATSLLLRGLPTVPAAGAHPTGELVTPTGAALMRGLADSFGPPPPMILRSVAYGLGDRDRGPIPNAVRLLVGERSDAEAQAVDVLTATIDDLDPRLYGPLLDRLFDDGALDVTLSPVQGKKGRPAVTVTIQAPPEAAVTARLQERLFRETTTLGLRRRREERVTLPRRFRTVSTAFGPVPVKEAVLRGEVVTVQPEFEACRAAADAHGVPVREVLDAARRAATPEQS